MPNPDQQEREPVRQAALLASQLMGGDGVTRARAQREIKDALQEVKRLRKANQGCEEECNRLLVEVKRLRGGLNGLYDQLADGEAVTLEDVRAALEDK